MREVIEFVAASLILAFAARESYRYVRRVVLRLAVQRRTQARWVKPAFVAALAMLVGLGPVIYYSLNWLDYWPMVAAIA